MGDTDRAAAPLRVRRDRGLAAQAASGRGIVPRQSLFDRLSGDDQSVALVCAAAGSGKTELVRGWLDCGAGTDRYGWVSVERDERDAQRFWLSLNDALADACETVRPADPVPQFRGEVLVERLLEDLGSLDYPAALVIDDLHELRAAEALEWLEVLLAALPRPLRAILLTREEPRLGLHRLRVAGRLLEVRGPDLRFTIEEADELLRAAGVALPSESVRLLHERTEGWVAGLRLAAISLARHPDPARFVEEFSGSERTVAQYLLEEVLERQPAGVRDVLLRTSLLQRVSGELADSLTGREGCERILQDLEDASAFVASIDAGRCWFRYHHLFADLLQLELRRIDPAMIETLHRAAAEWHEQHGDLVEAIRHLLAGADWAGAARLLAGAHIGLILDGRLATVRALLDEFPAGLAGANADLALVSADVRLREGSAEEAVEHMTAARRLAKSVPPDRAAQLDVLLAGTALEAASRRGDLTAALEAMERMQTALEGQSGAEAGRWGEIRALAWMSLGTAELWCQRLDSAREHLEEALALARGLGRPYLEVGCLAHLAIAEPLGGGSAGRALELSERAVALAESHGLDGDPVAALAFAVGAGSLACLGRFDAAEAWLDRAHRALRSEESPGTELALYHARGLLRLGQGRLEEALAAFRRAESMQALLAGEHALTIDLRLRIVLTLVQSGDSAGAAVALERLSDEDRIRAEGRIAAAAVALAGREGELAVELLEAVIDGSTPTWHLSWAALQALLYDAAARDQLGDGAAARASLEQAVALAEPEGLILPFAVAPVAELLERHRRDTAHPAFLSEIVDVLGGVSPGPQEGPAALLEALSDAELRVARLLPTNLKSSEIAAELFISTNTVRTHLSHIYAKLGAHSRAEAVARARELHLLGPSSRSR